MDYDQESQRYSVRASVDAGGGGAAVAPLAFPPQPIGVAHERTTASSDVDGDSDGFYGRGTAGREWPMSLTCVRQRQQKRGQEQTRYI